MILRQSTLKLWQSCALKYRHEHVDKLPREQSGSLTFGSILHDCVLLMERTGDVEAAVARFHAMWANPENYDPGYRIDYYVRGTNWKKYSEIGPKALRDWWALILWEADVILGREYTFSVPIGDGHTLTGTVDKVALRYRADLDSYIILASDYKSSTKLPTYEYLEDDLQFTAYDYASLQPEFWQNMPNGDALFEKYKNLPRGGEWVALQNTKRMDAGLRNDTHYNRLIYACNQIARSVEQEIYPPNISGATCRYCEFRQQCGLRKIDD